VVVHGLPPSFSGEWGRNGGSLGGGTSAMACDCRSELSGAGVAVSLLVLSA